MLLIARRARQIILDALARQPAVALLGPRQVGKTTLAHEVATKRASIYLDLESPADRAKLTDPELYLGGHEDELVIFDEVQRVPELFATLRGVIDRGRRAGRRAGRSDGTRWSSSSAPRVGSRSESPAACSTSLPCR